MRITMICAALLFALPASAQMPSQQPNCNRPPHQAGAAPSPQMMAARQNARQACAADIAAYCSNVPRECGEQMRCLMSHQSQLSQGCASARQNLRAARGAHS